MPSASPAHALRAAAFAFDAQRGKLPVAGDPHRSPEPTFVSRQIAELSTLVTDLSEEVASRAVHDSTAPADARVATAFAAALEPAGQAIAALGTVSHQLAFVDHTWARRHEPGVRDVHGRIPHVIEDALSEAHTALQDASTALHSAATLIAQPTLRLKAALSRTTTAIAKPSTVRTAGPAPAAPLAAAATRGR
ncbi:hypothetical protein [Streptomyces sp. RPT161]|uniref:hypothetical protein n=1 Tax=Streptomyces sp. RPT161 TaxID=3015993 RepID=UPI0022B87732|nr:hypothetical protein [Streptomyces sp. RPT161]